MGVTKCIDPQFTKNTYPVMALVSNGRNTYIVCRGEGAAGEVKGALNRFPTQKVPSSEAFNVMPDKIKSQMMVSADSIIKLPETKLSDIVMSLTEYSDGSPRNNLMSAELQAASFKEAGRRSR